MGVLQQKIPYVLCSWILLYTLKVISGSLFLFFQMRTSVFTGGFYYQLFSIYYLRSSICQEREVCTKPQVPDSQCDLEQRRSLWALLLGWRTQTGVRQEAVSASSGPPVGLWMSMLKSSQPPHYFSCPLFLLETT